MRARESLLAAAAPLVLLVALALPTRGGAEGLIELVDPLDEPERYCVDVPGWGRRTNLDAALMAHTCKPGAPDEMFAVNQPAAGQLYMPAYERCATAQAARAGAELFLRPCGSSPLQRFAFGSDGRIRLASADLCLAAAEGAGQPTGGPSHLRRDLALQACDAVDDAHSQWNLPATD